ncbi:hypothetical protein [Candidatus Electrothrix sp.]|uniref:hypothetical protein n=1 Tax=Candidatus Electrothrix sp. TaxID=2170559 RepID=UPI0040573829
MPYSDFTLKKVKEQFDIRVVEDQELYSSIAAVGISAYLTETLKYNVPLALAVGTEKIRSELIIANILLEVRRILCDQVSFFSGVQLDIDKQQNLSGFCNFVISKSPEQYYLNAPVIAIVEAKNENISGSLGQCIAEMHASRLFNEQEGVAGLAKIYGAVTTGNAWKFLKYEDGVAYIDVPEYHITDPSKIIGILVAMVNQEA